MIQAINFNAIKPLDGVAQLNKSSSPTPAETIKGFSSYLSDALDGVAAQEKNVEVLNGQFQLGQVNIEQVMIASEQALLSLQLTTQVRNKVIEAYQEIMRTQI